MISQRSRQSNSCRMLCRTTMLKIREISWQGQSLKAVLEAYSILAGDGKVLGIVTEFDLLKAIKEGKELWKVTAAEIMTKGAISVTQDTLAMEIIQLLQSKHLIRVAVVDAEGKLVGVVSRRDILTGYLRATKPIWRF